VLEVLALEPEPATAGRIEPVAAQPTGVRTMVRPDAVVRGADGGEIEGHGRETLEFLTTDYTDATDIKPRLKEPLINIDPNQWR